MRITAIHLKNFRQFRDFHLDLTDPETGQPLDKVCFIGSNGTGKSTLLALMNSFLSGKIGGMPHEGWFDPGDQGVAALRVRLEEDDYFVVTMPTPMDTRAFVVPSVIETSAEWARLWNVSVETSSDLESIRSVDQHHSPSVQQRLQLKANDQDLAIYAPPDSASLLKSDLPDTTLSKALQLFKELPAVHVCAYDQVASFWEFLIYQIKKRESDFQQFLASPEAQSMSVADARNEFARSNPEMLAELAKQWNIILNQAGLEFDVEHAQIPVQLNDNLKAYVRFKATKQTVAYNLLSTGIRNLIFRLGHVYALYFNRHIERGFFLLDEPEASLFPDLLYDIIERYLSVIRNTQFFVATHSPIIASQFRAAERIVLEFDDRGYVRWKRGVSPEGDDPNDILVNDFVVRSLYGKKGIEQWKRYLDLRRQIAASDDAGEKRALLNEYSHIGNAYNFAPHEIPE